VSGYGIGEVGDRADALAEVVRRARATIPFYRDRHAGVTSEALGDLPTCTKRDLAGYGYFPLSGGHPERAYRVCATSGTTGPRLFVGYSRGDWERIGARLAHRAAAVRFGAGDVLLNTHGYGLWVGGPTLDLLANVSGAGLIPSGPGGTQRMLEWLAELPITGLSATPSFMRYLVEQAAHRGVDPASWGLRVGFIGGEPASRTLRRQVSEVLGAQFTWLEFYGSTETGGPVLGFSPPEDPLSGQLLLDTEEFIVEILDPVFDEPVPPGEVGEIVVTTPYRELSPLIRYRTRDLAAAVADGDPHPSGLARVTSLLGRIDDALKVRGALVYPSVIEEVVLDHLEPGAEFRIELDRSGGGLDRLLVRVEHEDEPGFAERLGRALETAIVMRPVVETVPPGSLERFQGKAKRVVDRRPADEG